MARKIIPNKSKGKAVNAAIVIDSAKKRAFIVAALEQILPRGVSVSPKIDHDLIIHLLAPSTMTNRDQRNKLIQDLAKALTKNLKGIVPPRGIAALSEVKVTPGKARTIDGGRFSLSKAGAINISLGTDTFSIDLQAAIVGAPEGRIPSLQPQDFNVASNEFLGWVEYVKRVNDRIKTFPQDGALRKFLQALFVYIVQKQASDLTGGFPLTERNDKKSKDELHRIIKVYKKVIEKDFGEVLGPALVYARAKKGKYRDLGDVAHINFPISKTERMKDFSVAFDNDMVVSFSSKAGSSSSPNTVKPGDLIDSIDTNTRPNIHGVKKTDLKGSKEYQVIKALAECSAATGALCAVVTAGLMPAEWKKNKAYASVLKHRGYMTAAGSIIKKIPRKEVDDEHKNKRTKTGVQQNNAKSIDWAAAKLLIELSQNSQQTIDVTPMATTHVTGLNFMPLMMYAVNDKVSFIKFYLSNDGSYKTEIIEGEGFLLLKKGSVVLRAKQFLNGSLGERLGLTPP